LFLWIFAAVACSEWDAVSAVLRGKMLVREAEKADSFRVCKPQKEVPQTDENDTVCTSRMRTGGLRK